MANSALSALFCKYALILFPPDTLLRRQRLYRLSALRIAFNQNQLTICRQIELLRRTILTCLRLCRLQRGLRQHIRKRYGSLPQKVKVFCKGMPFPVPSQRIERKSFVQKPVVTCTCKRLSAVFFSAINAVM